MKKILSTIILLFILVSATAQKEKPAQTAPSQAEMDKMMKQMQGVMKDLPPEAKQMMDSMGLKMPDAKSIPSNKQISDMQTKYTEIQAQSKKDIQTVLAGLPNKILSEAEVEVFVKESFTKIDKNTDAKAKEHALRVIAESKAKNVSIENSAIALLMAKGSQEALWILSKLVTEDPQNANLLCNYSALVTMCNGAQLAIPVLNYLNKKYPKNSSILNNLGQAWYRLEKTDSAEKYLKLALQIYPGHSCANHTMANVCGSRGNTTAQIAYLKEAIKNGYSEKAEGELKKAGVKLGKNDIKWPFSISNDPAGLDKIDIPEFPMSTKTSDELGPKWKAFTSTCKAEAVKYDADVKKLGDELAQEQQDQVTQILKTKTTSLSVPAFSTQAGIYFKQDAELAFKKGVQASSDLLSANEEIKKLDEQYDKSIVELNASMEKKYKGRCPGEGCPSSQYCPDYANQLNKISDAYLAAANSLMSTAVTAQIDALKNALSIGLAMAVYTSTSEKQLQWQVATAKAAYMGVLADIRCAIITTAPDDCGAGKDKEGKIKLSDFDEVTCPSEDKLYIGIGIAKIAMTCTKFSVEGGELLQGSFEKNFNTGEFEIGIGVGFSEHIGAGPLSAEASVKAMDIFHFNGEGQLTDVGVKVSAGLDAKIGDLHVEGEGSVTAMLNTGVSTGIESSAGIKFLQ